MGNARHEPCTSETLKVGDFIVRRKTNEKYKVVHVGTLSFNTGFESIEGQGEKRDDLLLPGWTTGTQNGTTYYISPENKPQWGKPTLAIKGRLIAISPKDRVVKTERCLYTSVEGNKRGRFDKVFVKHKMPGDTFN